MQNNKINVQIIQPAVPKYRVPLFESLLGDNRFEAFLMAAKDEPGGVKSVVPFHENVDLTHPIKTILKKLMWQKDLYLLPNMSKGDVLIINGNIKFLSNYPLILEAKRRGVAVIWWGHGWSSTTSALSFFIRKYIMKLVADVLLLYTEKEKELFISNGFDENKIFYMNNTIDTGEINFIKKSISDVKLEDFKRKNKLLNKKVLLFVGRLREEPPTNLEVAIKALEYLSQDKKDKYVLIIIGGGKGKDKLLQIVEQLKLEDKVKFIGAVYEEKELAPWFMSADCFVYPGTIGLSLLHAFAYGLPVVTHDVIKEHGPEISALKDEVNGATFARNNEVELSKKIQNILNNKEYYSKNARETIENDYSYSAMLLRIKGCIMYASKLNRRKIL